MEEPTRFNLQEIIPALSLILDHQASGNLYHGFRVAIITYKVAENAKLKDKNMLFYAGLLHDMGLFETGEHIVPNYYDLSLQKSKAIFFNHPSVGAQIIKEIPGLEQAEPYILEHHEFFNGGGYPFGKREDEISLEAQILRLADSFDIELRRFPGLEQKKIIQFIESRKGKEFSPNIVSTFLGLDKRILAGFRKENNLKDYFYHLSKNISYPPVNLDENTSNVLLRILGRAIDGKHPYTNQHSHRVALYSLKLAKKIGLSKEECERIKSAGYLHDIGKIAISNAILDKPGPLTEEEWVVMRTHAEISYEIVNSVSYFKDFADVVFAAQEEYDGTGYPRRLKGKDIPVGARIIAIADAIDAMLSDRSYRKALPVETAVSELKKNAGSQFDPEITEAAIDLIQQKVFPVSLQFSTSKVS